MKHLKGLDAERVHEIDDCDFRGTLIYVIGEEGDEPWDYWYTKVQYGSCAECDTIQGIRGYRDSRPTKRQVADYMTLALHMVEAMHKMGDDVP